jgi:hypothetical protein
MLVFLSELLGIQQVIPFHELSLLTGLGRIVIIYIMLSLLGLGLTMGIRYRFCRVCESRGF